MSNISADSSGLLVVQIEVEPDYANELNDWYEKEHIPERLAMPGFRSAKRYVNSEGAPAYLAIYDLEYPEAATNSTYMSQAPSEWMQRLRPHWTSVSRSVWTPLPSPAGDQRDAGDAR